jgi:hypothetical protein
MVGMNDFMQRIKNVSTKTWIVFICIFLIGILAAIVMRFLFVDPPVPTHYHANFALYINNQKDEFKDFTFYEEIQACNATGSDDPLTRVHMHNQKNSEVHVHDSAATWGHFFANLGYGLTNKLVQTSNGVYQDGANGMTLSFILNGKQISDIYNRTIGDDDTLLISYGNEDQATLIKRYEQIPKTAEALNAGTDPASCTGSKSESFGQRIKRTLGITAEHSH